MAVEEAALGLRLGAASSIREVQAMAALSYKELDTESQFADTVS